MLTGDPPYAQAGSISSVVVAKVAGDERWRYQLLPGLKPATIELLHAMTVHNRSDRLSDYSLLIRRIDAILKSGSMLRLGEEEETGTGIFT